MALLDDIMQKTQQVGRAIAGTATDVVDFTKVSYNLATMENKLKSKYEEIGELLVTQEMAGEEPDVSELVAEAILLASEIEEIKEKRAEIKKTQLCPTCGKACPKDAAFCSECGTKM